MNQLAEVPSVILPSTISPALDLCVRVASNKLTADGIGFSIAAEDAPSDDDRVALNRRVARIDACLIRMSEKRLASVMGRLFVGLKRKARSEGESAITADLYVQALVGVPSFAVEQACDDYLFGRAGDGWVPDPGELRKYALNLAQPWMAEKARIKKVLEAKVRAKLTSSDNRKALVAAELAKLKTMREAGRKAECERANIPFGPEAEAQAKSPADWYAHAREVADKPWPSLSPELRSKYVASHAKAAE